MRLSSSQQLAGLLAVAYVARLLTLGAYPLTDNTEARYAEIARKMLETGQWIVPQIEYGVPFWGKPPLSFWLTALSFKLFGVCEFAARLPSLLLGVVVCGLAYILASRQRGIDDGLRASVVVATSLLMMISAGAVMTDPAMLLGTTLSMVAFWLALLGSSRLWGYLFFVGLAIGLLAKGPVATVLTLAPIGIWALLTGRMREVWRQMPWVTGMLLTAVLAAPWYWAAEVRSPGFLRYFIVGEHWQRYTVSGWKGDLYGSGHAYPPGTIWWYALLGTLPWSLWLLWQLVVGKAAVALQPLRSGDGWALYLLCWISAPVMFFTMARNILPTYVLPGLVGFGLLIAEVWSQKRLPHATSRFHALGVVSPVFLLLVSLLVWPRIGYDSQKEIVSAYRGLQQGDAPLAYFRNRPYSAEFYSRGSAGEIYDVGQLRQYLSQPAPAYLATERTALPQIPGDLRARLTTVRTSVTGQYILLRDADGSRGQARGAAAQPSLGVDRRGGAP